VKSTMKANSIAPSTPGDCNDYTYPLTEDNLPVVELCFFRIGTDGFIFQEPI